MIAQRLIEDARAAGLSFEVEGGDLIVEADRDPPPDLLAELRQHKAELLVALVPPVPASVPPPLPLLLSDGRRLWRFPADSIPAGTDDDCRDLAGTARAHGAVLVADGRDLILVERWLS